MILTTLPMASVSAEQNWSAQIPSKESAGATFRLGVISDSHLSGSATTNNNLDIALAAFSELGDVDAVAMNGDMVYAPDASSVTSGKYVYNDAEVNLPANLYSKVKSIIEANGDFTLAGTQEGDVFTADTSAGKPIIYSMGNHEFPENDRDTTRAAASKQLFSEQTGRNANHIMNVGGYTFIQSSAQDFFNDFRASEEFVMNQILAAEQADPSNKPIFYLQHEGVHGTVVGSDSLADGSTDEFKAFLNQHPRVIVLSAHTHAAEEDPRTIWQDGFTAVSTGKTGGGSVSGHGGSYSMGNNTLGSQCLMFDLTEGETKTDVKIYRLNLLTGLLIGEPWEFSIDGTTDTFKYNSSRYNNPSIAKFNSDAALTINNEARQGFKFTYHVDEVSVTPSEDFMQDDFVHSYRVVVKNTDANVVVQNFKVFADIFVADSDKVSSYSVTLPNQLDRATNYEVSVYALTPFTATASLADLEAKGVTPVKYAFKTSEELTAADKALIRTHEDVNVALNKQVIAGNPNHTAEKAASMVNGKYTDVIHADDGDNTDGSYDSAQIALPSGALTDSATHQQNDWFIIDLGRRYNISEVKVWSRQDTYNKIFMQYFDIEASNTEDFSECVTLGGVKSDAPSDKTTPVSVSGDGNSYRYIRLRRTGNSAYGYSEIEVFADVTTQEVSRNRQAEVNFQTYASMGAKYTVDGKLTNSSQCWLIESLKSTSPNPPYNLVVDLEQDYPIGFIEMFGRYGVNASTYRNNWKIYGFTDAQGKPDANISDFSEAALLWSVTSAYPQITNGTNPEGLKAPITGNGKYRYVVFSKTKKELAAIGEIRAEVIIPEIASVERLSDTSLSVSFSEKMNAESLAEGITVVSDSGTVYTPSEVKLTDATAWDGGYDATVAFAESLPASGISLNVDGEVKTYAGATFVEDCQVRISGKTVEINKEYAETIENVNVALNKPVYANQLVTVDGTVVMNPDAAKLTNGQRSEHVQPPSYTSGTVTLPSGDTVKASAAANQDWYVVDLGQRYNIKEIKFYSRGDESSVTDNWMTKFDIEVSNSILFDDYKKVGGVDSSLSDAGITSSSTPCIATLDGKEAYRYVRIKKTAWTYYGWSELEVYADVTATEVSRGAAVTVDEGYTNALGDYATQKMTDGVKNVAYHGVLFEGITYGSNPIAPPYNVLVDLGAEYPIGFIQMWSRGDETSGYEGVEAYRRNWTVYGANATNAPQNAQDTANSTAILSVGSKEYPASGLKAMIAGGTYRYLTFSKVKQELGCIGEIRASVINPKAYSAKVNDDGTITVAFTDKMETSTLVEDNFSIGGVALSNPVTSTGWDDGYSVTFDYDGVIADGMPLVISEKVRNEKGIELSADQTIAIEATEYTVTVDGAESDAVVADKANIISMAVYSEDAVDAIMYVAVKDADGRLISCVMSEATAIAKGEASILTAPAVTPKTGEKVYVYVWVKDTHKPLMEMKSLN